MQSGNCIMSVFSKVAIVRRVIREYIVQSIFSLAKGKMEKDWKNSFIMSLRHTFFTPFIPLNYTRNIFIRYVFSFNKILSEPAEIIITLK